MEEVEEIMIVLTEENKTVLGNSGCDNNLSRLKLFLELVNKKKYGGLICMRVSFGKRRL